MRFLPDDLERRLTEFQVVENARGEIVGAIGLQTIGQHALLHSEGYTDFSLADSARELFWERIQTIAAHHGVFRLWTREQSPFWTRWGFQPAPAETLERLPGEWNLPGEKWLTLQIKNEEALTRLDQELAEFKKSEKQRMAQTLDQARTLTRTVTTIAFMVAFVLIGAAIYIIVRRNLSPLRH